MTAVDPFDPDAPKLWEWSDGDTDNSYGAFCAYRDLGPRRSLSKAMPIVYGATDGGQNLAQLKLWSRENNWVARAAAYDRYADAEALLEQAEQRREMRRQHAELASGTIANIAGFLMNLEPSSLGEAARVFKDAVAIERQARGEADVSVDMQVEHSSDMTRQLMADPEARALMLAALEKAAHLDDRAE